MGTWLSSTDFPKLEFQLAEPLRLDAEKNYCFQVNIKAANSKEYVLSRQRYLSKIREMNRIEKDFKNNLRHLKSARKEIADIKAGKPFRFGMKVFSLLGFLKR